MAKPVGARSSVATLFLEDEHGRPVSDEVQEAVLRDVRALWADLAADPETRDMLDTQNQVGFRIYEDFRKTMEGKYPWLRLCEGSWKVQQLWQNTWTSWARTHKKPGSTPVPTSDSEAEVTAGEKRKSTDEGDHPGPSKKVKGKEVKREPVPTASTTRPSQCAVKNVGVKVAKAVLNLCYPLHHKLTYRPLTENSAVFILRSHAVDCNTDFTP